MEDATEHPDVREGMDLLRGLVPRLPDAKARRRAAALIAVLERLGQELSEREPPWHPLRPAKVDPEDAHADLFDATYEGRAEVWLNDRYQVVSLPISFEEQGGPRMLYLSVKRRDRSAVHDWRDLQRIKNQLAGEEAEAVELYPAESRLRDEANQYHLWCLMPPGARFPFGFDEGRQVREAPGEGHSRQRPWAAEGDVPEEVEGERQGGAP